MQVPDNVARIRAICPHVYAPEEYGRGRELWRADVERLTGVAARREDELWAQVRTVADWERFRDIRIAALRESLGGFLSTPPAVAPRVTGVIAAAGYRIEKLVFNTRPGLVVSALLYLPEPRPARMPLIQVVHAHHTPKEHGELQDMGVNWARHGAAVLVPDLVGHGERREDPFGAREGYYSRYYSAMQLNLVGESLAGWMAWDLVCGNSVLLGLTGADPTRLILIGSVAGGGDLSALAAALDPRVSCSIPFNFGAGASSRELFGSGYWETTRNLWRSVRDGFAPWVIVAAAAPRHLIYAHEFSWTPDKDLAWARIRKIYDLYGVPERLGSMRGEGRCAPGPQNTHCTHVGPLHRSLLYPWLERWFDMPPPLPEVQERRPPEELICRDEAAQKSSVPLRLVMSRQAGIVLEPLRQPRTRAACREAWADVLGSTDPLVLSTAETRRRSELPIGRTEAILLRTEPENDVPMLLIRPAGAAAPRVLVIGVAQQGKEIFLQRRAPEIARLLAAGGAVCLADLRGTGETRPDEMHGLESELINLSEGERMMGRSAMALQLRDLRCVIRYWSAQDSMAGCPLALWGESFAPVNEKDFKPGRHDSRKVDNGQIPNLPYGPAWAEPLAPFVVLLAALFEDAVRAVLSRRGLIRFASVFDDWAASFPSDAIVHGALLAGDVPELVRALAPLPVRMESPVDALNRAVPADVIDAAYGEVRHAYAGSPSHLVLQPALGDDVADWLCASIGAHGKRGTQ